LTGFTLRRRTGYDETVATWLNNPTPRGMVELVLDAQHFERVVLEGMLRAKVTLDISTADLKAMLVPLPREKGMPQGHFRGRPARSIVRHLADLAQRGVEVRVLHSGVPSGPALQELRGEPIRNLTFRRCPRLHAKMVVIDAAAMYLGSANLTGAGLGAKGAHKRNFEMGVWTTDAALIDAALEPFNRLWEGQRCQECQRREVCPVPLEEPRLSPGK
jgi:phosphatidylserine/phosphatidylglycerophosphate/cardiolipin synthase-like enzyme